MTAAEMFMQKLGLRRKTLAAIVLVALSGECLRIAGWVVTMLALSFVGCVDSMS